MEKACKEAEQYYTGLRERGVSLLPLVVSDGKPEVDPAAKLKALKRELNRRDT